MGLTVAEFVWLRPQWLWALALLPLVWWLWRRRRGQKTVWQRAVDPHLLPHLLQHIELRSSWRGSALALAAATLAIVALAGPSLRQQPTPLVQQDTALVIALDLSAAMRAADLPPSRVVQAKAKLAKLLQERRAGQVGLLVYAGDAFTVAPITRDARTVSALLDSLAPDIMPVQGQRADRAIEHALTMLRDSGVSGGEILLVSDHADGAAERAAATARAAGVAVSALGVGTLAGAPLTGSGGFITGADGKALLARLDPASLVALAAAGGGRYTPLVADESDLAALGVLEPVGAPAGSASNSGSTDSDDTGLARSDDGYWLLLLLLPLMLVGFRRGWLAMLPLVAVIGMSMPPTPALADAEAPSSAVASAATTDPQPASRFSWEALWRRADQRAFAALKDGDIETARSLAADPALAGAAAYRGDDFDAAANAWSGNDSADAHYNRGNALARSGKLEDALRAYDDALARQPGMADALANRKAVEDFLKQQQSQQQPGQQGDKSQSDKKSEQGEQGQQGEAGGQDQQGEQSPQDEQDGKGEQGEEREPQSGDPSASGDPAKGEQQQGEKASDEQSGEPGSASEAESEKGAAEGEQSEPQADPGEGDRDGDGKSDRPSEETAAKAEDAAGAAEREAAEAAARKEMQQALEAQQGDPPADAAPTAPMTAEQRAQAEQRQATEQWMRRVPDDPGALLRRKFELEYRRRLAEGDRQ